MPLPASIPTRPSAGQKISDIYVLGNEIGKGGFGTVFECQNTETGETVAVKRISLRNLSSDQLSAFEQEISLLKKLDHPNIVKYTGTIRAKDHLHILLEFMENGSLTRNIKRFGSFREPLLALYIRQVLQGLVYLHEQGVIHRDIKGANILTTKSGQVKLADFGVATHASSKSNEVVGTPYWMAPEVIEMSGPTSACDIWSVGCTIVELLTGKPPYYDIPPMAALYRIVQDDHPPFPEGISPALDDFLSKCFKKEPMLRTSAQDLLRHRWIRKERDISEENALHRPNRSSSIGIAASVDPGPAPEDAADFELETEDIEEERNNWRKSVMNTIKLSGGITQQSNSLENGSSPPKPPPTSAADAGDDDDDDDWDAEFADEPAGQSATARPMGAAQDGSNIVQSQWRAMNGISLGRDAEPVQVADDQALGGGDFDFDDLDDAFSGDQTFQRESMSRRQAGSAGGSAVVDSLAKYKEVEDEEYFDIDLLGPSENDDADVDGRLSMQLKSHLNLNAEQLELDDPFADEFDDWEDENDFIEDAGRSLAAQQKKEIQALMESLNPKESNQKVLEACAKLSVLFREQPMQRRNILTHHGVSPIMEMLEVSNPEVLAAVLKVLGQIIENDRMLQELLSLAGLIPIVSKFVARNVPRPVRLQAASVVKQLLNTSKTTLQMFIACGGLRVLVELLEPSSRNNSSLEDRTTDFALSYISIDGIQLVFQSGSESGGKIPKNDFCQLFGKAGLLTYLARVMQGTQSNHGREQCSSLGFDALYFAEKISGIFLVFSHGDANAKKFLADIGVLQSILATVLYYTKYVQEQVVEADQRTSRHIEAPMTVIKNLLKCVRNLSMEPSALQSLQTAGCIPTLVPYLSFELSEAVTDEQVNQSIKEIKNMIMLSMFYMCRLSRVRQEQAAVAGIINPLKHAIITKSPVKTFAIQILCDLATASAITRQQLWQFGGIDFLLELLVSGDVFFQEKALMSLEAWLSNSTPEVERALLTPFALEKVVTLFQSAKHTNFENIVKELLEMLNKSAKLTEALGRSGLFMAELVVRLRFPKAEVRINLLKLLKLVGEFHHDLQNLILEHNLYVIVMQIAAEAEKAQQVLVVEIANQLLKDWSAALELEE